MKTVLGLLARAPAFLLANWQALAVAAVAGWFGLQILGLKAENAGLRKEVGELEERLGRTVDVVTKAELDAALKVVGQEIATQVEGLHETIKAVPRGKDIIFIRDTSRPGLPGKPGVPGPPGKPGTPLIPPTDQPKAREEAIERILAWFDLGTLVNCDTAGIPPSTVEFLRQPGGRILSTAPCVFRINDELRLREVPPPTPVRSPWKGLAAYHVAGGGWGLGVGYTLASLWKLDLDAVALASLTRRLYLGPGASVRATETLSLGAAYTYGLTERTWTLWGYVGVRF